MVDFDDIFKMATPKYVYIRDKKLGILKYSFMGGIFFYVVIYELLYSCEHLSPHPTNGYGSLRMIHPMDKCKDGALDCPNKYKNIAELGYCIESKALEKKKRLLSGKTEDEKDDENKDEDAEEDGPQIGEMLTKPAACRYLDDDRLLLQEIPNELFLPTRYVSLQQSLSDDCYDPLVDNVHPTAIKDYRCKKSWQTDKEHKFYVADIGDFTVTLQHSYVSPSLGLSGVSTEVKGFFASCPTNHPKDLRAECKVMEIPNTSGDVAAEDRVGLVEPESMGVDSLTGGPDGLDHISLLDLLKLTPIAHDPRMADSKVTVADRKLPDKFGHPDTSIRESGGMIMLAVDYDNTGYGRPGIPGLDMPKMLLGAVKPITYTYKPYFIPTHANKKVEVLFKSDAATKRTVNIWYGITVKMSFEGKLCKFMLGKLFSTLATALVLVTSATTLVTYMALYLFKASDKYTLLMYQYSEDFSDYKNLLAAGTGTARDVDYACGEKLIDAAKKSNPALSAEDTYTLLANHELRMNKLDGRDPKLAFIQAMSAAEKETPAGKIHEKNEEFENEFYKRCGVKKALD